MSVISKEEFSACVDELLLVDDVRRLNEFSQHFNTSRLEHSINVSYLSFCMCRALRFDSKSAARAGLLHDLFLYDWRTEKREEGRHAFAHPKVALKNAKRITSLNRIEEDAIGCHMWPVARFPRYKESYIVSLADKLCATYEFWNGFKKFVQTKKWRSS